MSRHHHAVDYDRGHVDEEETSPAAAYLGTEDNPKVQLDAAQDAMWAHETEKIKHLHVTSDQDFKTIVDLPLARIKRIMKSDEDVRMISAEAPVLFAKACELFIMDLTMRAWQFPREDKPAGAGATGHHHHSMRPGTSHRSGAGGSSDAARRLLTKESVLDAIRHTDSLDFLVPIMLPAGSKPAYLLPPAERAKLTAAAAAPMSQQALALQSTFNYYAPAAPVPGSGATASSSSSGGGASGGRGGSKKGGAASSSMASSSGYYSAAESALATSGVGGGVELPMYEGDEGMMPVDDDGAADAALPPGRGARSRSKGAKKR